MKSDEENHSSSPSSSSKTINGDTNNESTKLIELANGMKEEGNHLLSIHKYSAACEKYSEAIQYNPNNPVFYANRAQAKIKLELYGSAIEDANEALKLDPRYIKAYYRRGSANYAIGQLKLALKDFKAVVKLVPKDPDAIKKLKACEKDVKDEAFSKAIESDESAAENVDIESIQIEDSYDGPRLKTIPNATNGDVEIDLEFINEMIERFKQQKLIHRKIALQILSTALNHFKSIPSLLRLSIPSPFSSNNPSSNPSPSSGSDQTVSLVDTPGCLIVCGDTHGQFYDLCNIFQLGGFPSRTTRYLFNGDFVDRGSFSVENILTLLTLKIALPDALFLLRGNHETINLNKMYGFTGEVLHKYDAVVMNMFTKVFKNLPLAAVLEDKVFVVHGGLSTENDGRVALSTIEEIPRNVEPPSSGLFSDLLWSDPHPLEGKVMSKRGIGFSFGSDYTKRFLEYNHLQLVIRSHEVKDEGYEVEHDGKCITVFSAPNYCDQMGNQGAFIRFTDRSTMTPQFVRFNAVPHPNVPPMRYASNMFAL